MPGAKHVEMTDRDQRVLVHGIAVIEVPDHQAIDDFHAGKNSGRRPVSCIPEAPTAACGATEVRSAARHL